MRQGRKCGESMWALRFGSAAEYPKLREGVVLGGAQMIMIEWSLALGVEDGR